MISSKDKCIFVHIPKTAGTSIKKFFGIKVPGVDYHLTALESKNKYSKDWDNFYTFSFVRNPWSRVSSIYHYYKFGSEGINKKIKNSLKSVDFTNFCNSLIKEKSFPWAKAFEKNQYSWLSDSEGNIIIDHVGKIETLEEDMKIICNKIGRTYCVLPHERKSSNTDYKSLYDDYLIDLIKDYDKEIIELFNYEF